MGNILGDDETVDALRNGLEDLVTQPGMHNNPDLAMQVFDQMQLYPVGVSYRDRACKILQDLRFGVDEIDHLLNVLGF